MDKLSDFFKEFKNRINNPFFASFIISWLLINWKITFGVLFYYNESLKNDGYKSKIDLVVKNYNVWKFVWWPLIFALIYIAFFPILKNLIQAYNSLMHSWGSDLELEYAKKGKIPVEKYIELRKTYDQRIEDLERAVENESTLFVENEVLKKKLVDVNSEMHKIQKDLSFIHEKSNIISYNGEWRMKYRTSDNSVRNERVWIGNGDISALNDNSVYISLFKILSASYNSTNSQYIWIVEEVKEKRTFFIIFRPTNGNNVQFLRSTNNNSIIMELEVA